MYSNDIFHDNTMYKQVKPGFTNYQPQPKYSWALVKTEGLRKRSEKLKYSENQNIQNF